MLVWSKEYFIFWPVKSSRKGKAIVSSQQVDLQRMVQSPKYRKTKYEQSSFYLIAQPLLILSFILQASYEQSNKDKKYTFTALVRYEKIKEILSF